MRTTLALAAAVALPACGADMMNNALIHEHVDDLVAHDRPHATPADRWLLTAGALVPGLGSYRLDHRVYGSLRPSAIVFDWILGGLVPAALLATSFAVDGAHTSSTLRWTALAAYGVTRIAVVSVGTMHITEYDGYLAQRLATETR